MKYLVQLLRGQLDDMRAQLLDLQKDRDRWHAAFEAAQRQLAAPAQPDARVSNAVGNRWQRAWRWMRATA